MPVETQRLHFHNTRNERLAARLEITGDEPAAFAIFAHCFTCSKDLKAVRWIGEGLAEEGIAVLRFDFTGMGESEGRFEDTNFTTNIEDVVAAADFLRESYRAPRLLIGHSLGGAAVLAAASRIPEVAAVATIAAPSTTQELCRHLAGLAPGIETHGEADIQIGGRPVRIKRQLLDDLETHSLEEAIRSLNRPLLIFHSPSDPVLSIRHAYRIYELASEPRSIVSLDRADHLLLQDERDARFVSKILASFAERYLLG